MLCDSCKYGTVWESFDDLTIDCKEYDGSFWLESIPDFIDITCSKYKKKNGKAQA